MSGPILDTTIGENGACYIYELKMTNESILSIHTTAQRTYWIVLPHTYITANVYDTYELFH